MEISPYTPIIALQLFVISFYVISDLFIALQLFVHCTCALFHTVDCTSHMCIAVIANGGDKSEGHRGIHRSNRIPLQ